MAHRVFNFSAGPSTLPVPVLEQAQSELLDYRGTGMSVMEMSHRSAAFEAILAETIQNLRTLLGVPNGHQVLLLQGGASLQFGTIPMAFLPADRKAQYVITGAWGEKAIESAQMVGQTEILWSGAEGGYRALPGALSPDPDAAYVHLTTNETIQGVQYSIDPDWQGTLVADVSSDFLSRPLDVSRYGILYGGAQKNLGPAGLTVVVISDEVLACHRDGLPPMLDYRVQVKNNSMLNTPPTWSIYVSNLVLQHLLAKGGLPAVHASNVEKAKVLYDAIDASEGFYAGHAATEVRSLMNVVFTLRDDSLTKAFLAETTAAGLDGLKGHRSVGGIRASLYNAFPIEGSYALRDFMVDFANRNG